MRRAAVDEVDDPASSPGHPEEGDEGLRRLRPWIRLPTAYGGCFTYREVSPCPPPVAVPDLDVLLGDERLKDFDPDRALYLDIEATGLSHGAGTFAFLIGVAYVEDGEVVLEQLFMRDPTDEMPVLGRFMQLIDRFDFLVSFNGKSYDLSVLQARLVVTRLMSRLDSELKVRPHLDLLHACRKAWKGVFENTKLQTLEREVLHLDPAERANDVPGSMVPALYFHYLCTGYAPHLDPVLAHNRTDVLSMVTLTRRLLDLMRDPLEEADRWDVRLNLARHALRMKLNGRAAALFEAALLDCPPDMEHGALVDLVTAYRRAGELESALDTARRARRAAPDDEAERGRLERQIARFARKLDRR